MEQASRVIRFDDLRQLEEKYRQHASTYGFPLNYNRANGQRFIDFLRSYVEDPDKTQRIVGTFRRNIRVIHYFEPATRMNIMVYPDGSFITVYQLSAVQVEYLLSTGDVGGGAI